MNLKHILISGVIGFLLGMTVMYFLRKCEKEIIKVPIKIEVPVPGVKDSFPYEVPVPKPYPVQNPINEDLKRELAQAKSQLDSLKILKEFVKPKLYTHIFEDKIQKIKVGMIASGSVDSVKVDYDIFPKTIPIDTIINVPIPKQWSLWVKGSAVLPGNESLMKPTLKPGLMIIPKKGNLAYDFEVDFTNKNAEVGLAFRF